jgi:hypothetical protein
LIGFALLPQLLPFGLNVFEIVFHFELYFFVYCFRLPFYLARPSPVRIYACACLRLFIIKVNSFCKYIITCSQFKIYCRLFPFAKSNIFRYAATFRTKRSPNIAQRAEPFGRSNC